MKNECQFCQKETDLSRTFVAMGPRIEEYEIRIKEITEKYQKDWWEAHKHVDPKEIDDLTYYDQLINTIGRGYICKECFEKDDELYEKYSR